MGARRGGTDGGLAVGVLGPLQVSAGGRRVVVTTGRLRTLLVALAMSAGRQVSVDRLAAALWGPGEDLPGDVRRTVQTYMTRLRGLLGAGSIGTRPSGYLLRTEPDRVDALRFERLLDAAALAPDPPAERDRLAEALALWRGDPFEGVSSTWLDQSESPRLVERYLTAVERRVDLELAAEGPDEAEGPCGGTDGRYGELVARLGLLTARHPLRETLWVRLLTVLDRSGRQAEALDRYEGIRAHLADELGVEPGPELRQVHADLLAGRAVRPSRDPERPAPTRWTVARQLPPDVAGFTGRAEHLRLLDGLLPADVDNGPSRATVIAVHGTAGVGKTTLAVRWARRVSDRFPDGQLYANLRGFDPSRTRSSTAEVVHGFLDALGVPRHEVPAGLDAQLARYRGLLAGRRVLVILDNAGEAEQVRPLLPGGAGCLVVVTSRNQLPGLVAVDGAHPVRVGLFAAGEARDLLARRLGRDRVAAEPGATDEIINLCARLPLALAVAAAHAANQPSFPIAALATQLREVQDRLDAFADGDAAIDVRAVFSWSYQALTAGAAELFRRLGTHPGPNFAAHAAASLAGLPLPRVRTLLSELTRAHLVEEHAPGRYTFHDLLRAYAAELAQTHDSPAERRVAMRRTLDHYLHTAHAAAQLLDPHRLPIGLDPPGPGVTLAEPGDEGQAVEWLGAEHGVLLAAIRQATGNGFDAYAWRLAGTLAEFFARRGRWQDFADAHRIAVAAAERLADPAGQAHAYHGLGRATGKLGRYDQAHTCYLRALRFFRIIDDRPGQASAHLGASWLLGLQGRYRDAIAHAWQAHSLYDAAGAEAGRANACNAIGWYHARLGDYRKGIAYCRKALALHADLADRQGEANTWDSLGYAHHHLGRHRTAMSCYERAIGRYREASDRYGEADTLTRLGDTQQAAGHPQAARTSWQHALTILAGLDHPGADQLRERLRDPNPVGHLLAGAAPTR